MATLNIKPSKVTIPHRRTNLVSRPRLLELFNDLLDYKLFIVAAPAGYGKTSLIVDFASNSPMPVCWFSMDSSDQDIQRFLINFVSAIQMRFPHFGKSSLAVIQSVASDKIDSDVTLSIINKDLFDNVSDHFVIVLDDYHLVESSKAVNGFINNFLQEVDENCHLVIASRTLLTLTDMPLFVAHSEVGGLSYAELAFDRDEIQKLFEQNNHLSLDKDEAEKLARETEGWITGLLLSSYVDRKGIADRLRVARISGVGLYDYLAQQVLNQQSIPIQNCLLQTSLLDEFDADICQEIIGRALGSTDDWGDLINLLLSRNLFIQPSGIEKVTFRYHHLFRDFLRNRMLRTYPSDSEKILKRLAIKTEQQGDWEKTYQIYIQLKSDKEIPSLIERAGPAMLSKGRIETLEQWLRNLPIGLTYAKPGLLSLQGVVSATRGHLENGIKDLLLANEFDEGWSSVKARIQNLIRLITAHRLHGDFQLAMQEAKQVLKLVGIKTEFEVERGDAFFNLGVIQLFQGDLFESLQSFEKATSIFERLKDFAKIVNVKTQMATAYKSLGEFAKAEAVYNNALEYCQTAGNIVWQVSILNSLGILQQLLGEYEKSIHTFEKALDYAQISKLLRNQAYITASIADWYYEMDNCSEARESLRQATILLHQFEDRYLSYYIDLSYAEISRYEGDFAQAEKYLTSANQKALDGGAASEIQRCKMTSGILHTSMQQFQKAREELEESCAYFRINSFRAEHNKAATFLIIVYGQLVEKELMEKMLQLLLSTVENPELEIMTATNIRISAQWLIPTLEKMEKSSAINKLKIVVERQQKRLATLRGILRPQHSNLPMSAVKLSIKCFGRTQIKIADALLTKKDWHSQTARDIFLFLLLTPSGSRKETICEIFWPKLDPAEVKIRFKNTMYRLRRAVGKEIVQFINDTYSVNFSIEHEIDSELFRYALEAGKKSTSHDERFSHLENAIQLYRGDFLTDVDYDWAILERENLRRQYIDALLELSEYYLKIRKFEKSLQYAQNIIKVEPYNESGYLLSMRAYSAMKNKSGVVRQFGKYQRFVQEHLGNEISQTTRDLFEELSQ